MMKHIVIKPYWNFEKEEKWLNEMSAKGLALVKYSWCKYTFEDCEKNEYIYRLELLKKYASDTASIQYIKFLEEAGVEYIASFRRWAYFRKKSTDGDFDIYSDIDSKIAHYKRILIFWCSLIFTELAIGFLNIAIWLRISLSGDKISINLFCGLFLTFSKFQYGFITICFIMFSPLLCQNQGHTLG